jgi:cell division protein FtsQ
MRRMRRPLIRRRTLGRRVLWWGVAPGLVAGGFAAGFALIGGGSLWHEAAATALADSARLGLAVADIEVEGRTTTDRETILAALGAGVGTPIFAVSPSRAKEELEKLPWVRSATIERRLPDTIYVRLVERKPLALWQHDGRIELIDHDGAVIPVRRLDRFAKLPLVVGAHAAQHAAALLDMLASEPDLAGRVGAAVWVGDRRWNLRLDDRVDVLLPEDNPAAAWAELARLQHTEQLLERDVETVDMRLPDRLVLRVGPDALPKDKPGAKNGHQTAKNT